MLPAATRGALPASDNVVRALLAIVLAEIFVALLPVAAIQFLLSARFANVLQPVGIGLGLTIASMLLWGQRTAAWFPYAYPGVVVMQRFGTLTPTSGAAATADTAFQIPAAAFGAVRPVRPVILVDHAHENLHTIKSDQGTGSLRWMLAPAKVAGIDVRPIADPWTEEQLRTAGLLIVAGVAERAASPAVSDAEVATLAAWVEQGGSLLLLTDHDPYAEALQGIARRFNVEFSGGMFADASHGDPRVPTSNRLYFSRANGLLGSHPLTEGVRAVITYGGQAVWRTEGEASRILALAPTARNAAAKGAGPSPNAAQLLAFSVGKGRVVIAGETAWFTAQITEDGTRIGVGDPMVDNGKLAVNTLRWLLGGN